MTSAINSQSNSYNGKPFDLHIVLSAPDCVEILAQNPHHVRELQKVFKPNTKMDLANGLIALQSYTCKLHFQIINKKVIFVVKRFGQPHVSLAYSSPSVPPKNLPFSPNFNLLIKKREDNALLKETIIPDIKEEISDLLHVPEQTQRNNGISGNTNTLPNHSSAIPKKEQTVDQKKLPELKTNSSCICQ